MTNEELEAKLAERGISVGHDGCAVTYYMYRGIEIAHYIDMAEDGYEQVYDQYGKFHWEDDGGVTHSNPFDMCEWNGASLHRVIDAEPVSHWERYGKRVDGPENYGTKFARKWAVAKRNRVPGVHDGDIVPVYKDYSYWASRIVNRERDTRMLKFHTPVHKLDQDKFDSVESFNDALIERLLITAEHLDRAFPTLSWKKLLKAQSIKAALTDDELISALSADCHGVVQLPNGHTVRITDNGPERTGVEQCKTDGSHVLGRCRPVIIGAGEQWRDVIYVCDMLEDHTLIRHKIPRAVINAINEAICESAE